MPRRARKTVPAPFVDDPFASGLQALCKAASDALRLQILRVLSVDSFAVLELAHLFDMPQPGMSHHLRILADSGLLVTRREGNSIFYRRALVPPDHPLTDFHQALYRAVDQLELAAPLRRRIAEIHARRAQHSREFFRRNAGSFKQNQELIARFSQYDASVEDLIRSEAIDPEATVVEIGPGEGELLLLLSRRFAHVHAVDNSPEMLERARHHLERHKRSNVRFVEGEIADLIDEQIEADLIVLNMVLHHMPSPSRVFREARRLLTHEGTLAIIDLCPHDQDWVQESCGDLWFGFDPDDLALWAGHAGLVRGQGSYLALRNGFQIQMQSFHDAARANRGPGPTVATGPP